MAQPVPPGIDPILWNLALLVTQIQQLQAQVQPITAQQIATLQAAIVASPALGSSTSLAVVSQGLGPAQQLVTPP